MTRTPLLKVNPPENFARHHGRKYRDYLVTTRPIRLAGRNLKAPAMLVPCQYRYRDGATFPWTVLYPDTPSHRDDGWRNWQDAGGATAREVEELRRLDHLDRSPEDLALLEDLNWPGDSPMTIAVATIDVPPAGIHSGDPLVRAYGGDEQAPRSIRGRFTGLSLDDYETLREAVREHGEGAKMRHITPYYVWRQDSPYGFLNDKRQWGRRLKCWYSRLFVARPFRTAVSAPVEATSDDGAIFELLADVGCRMPAGGAS